MSKRFTLLMAVMLVTVFLIALVPAASAQDYSDHSVVLGYAEIITDPASGEAGRVEWFQNDLGNAQLGHDFVYGDPRNAFFWNGATPSVTFAVNTSHPSSDPNLTNQNGWLYDSIWAWDALTCSNLGLSELPATPGNIGVVANYFNTGGFIDISLVDADLTQVGFVNDWWLGGNTLGVTYTLMWVDGAGNLTDIDNNGKYDVAFREIYYNDKYEWADNGVEGRQPDGTRVFDFPAVAIHEVGHGFSQAHFGNIGIQDGALKATPHSIMNAIYGGIQRDLTGRDVGGHCSNWSQWPNN